MDQLMAMRAFTRVVESGSFTRAADSLNMPIATLSKLVKSLEAHLGNTAAASHDAPGGHDGRRHGILRESATGIN